MKLAAVIVENRAIPNIYQIKKQHEDFLPEGTPIFHLSYSSIKTEQDYNRVLTSSKFWKDFMDFDRVLIFQHDSMLLRTGIEEFYLYDYVGAPWKFQNYGGNGGLSLRSPQVMADICDKFNWSSNQGNEDVWFCNIMHNHKIGNLAPLYVAEKFSCEAIFRLGTLGYHAINKWLTPSECDQIKNQYK